MVLDDAGFHITIKRNNLLLANSQPGGGFNRHWGQGA